MRGYTVEHLASLHLLLCVFGVELACIVSHEKLVLWSIAVVADYRCMKPHFMVSLELSLNA